MNLDSRTPILGRRPLAARLATIGLTTLLTWGAIGADGAFGQGGPPTPGQGQGQGQGQGGDNGGDNGGRNGGGRRGGGFGRMFGGGGGFGGGFMGGGPGGGGGGMRDLREQLEPDFVRRDVPIFVQQLKLDKTQSTVLETVMKDYEDEFTEASTAVQNQITELGQQLFQNVVSPQMRDRMQDQMRQVQDDLQQLREEKGGELDDETRRQFFRERMQKFQQEAMEERKASGADAEMKKVLGQMFEKVNEWMSHKEKMRTTFIDGLKANLNDDQLGQWDAFDRFLRREKTLPKGRLSGESVNLFFVMDELKLSDEDFAKAAGQLDEYERGLDNALRQRNDYLASSAPKLFKSMQEGDAKEAIRVMERQVELRTAVRNVNDQYRQGIVNALGAESEAAKKFEKAALQAGYDRVYRASTAERAFAKALELTDIDEGVRRSIVDLQAQFLSEMGMKNRDVLAILQKNEPGQQNAEAGRFVSMMASMINGDMSFMNGPGGPFGDRGPDPVRDAMDGRREIDDKYLERLKALLTPEQVEQLPKREQRGGPGGGGGFTRMLDNMPEDAKNQIIKRFDKNGDGQLDDNERGEAFRAMRDEFGGPGGPGGPGGRGGAGGGGDAGAGGGGGGGRRGRGQNDGN